MYINQGYLSIKNNKRMFYADYYILGQITEALNVPKDVFSYVRKKKGELKSLDQGMSQQLVSCLVFTKPLVLS